MSVIFAVSAFADANKVYSGTVRLHVLAESDSREDQALKLSVRDKILDYIADEIDLCSDVNSAAEYIRQNQDGIRNAAIERIKELGYDYDVNVSFCREYYPTREYEDARLPAGEYLSLKVIIGSGSGRNWWCVLYPPLCKGSASVKEELAEAGFTPNQVRLITEDEDEGYVIKFKLIESAAKLFEKLKNRLR